MIPVRAGAGVCLAAGIADLLAINLWIAPAGELGAAAPAPAPIAKSEPRRPPVAEAPTPSLPPAPASMMDVTAAPVATTAANRAPQVPPAPDSRPPARDSVAVVFFGLDRATVAAPMVELLRDAAGRAAADPEASVAVDGYADRLGDEGHNQALSEQRARAVADVLARLGVPPARIVVQAHGASRARDRAAGSVAEAHERCAEVRVSRTTR